VGASTFQFLPGGKKVCRLDSDGGRDVNQVRFMRFEETKQGCKQGRLGGSAAQVFCVDSGQVEEPLRTAFVRQRGGKR
jgi:hypothetical protein